MSVRQVSGWAKDYASEGRSWHFVREVPESNGVPTHYHAECGANYRFVFYSQGEPKSTRVKCKFCRRKIEQAKRRSERESLRWRVSVLFDRIEVEFQPKGLVILSRRMLEDDGFDAVSDVPMRIARFVMSSPHLRSVKATCGDVDRVAAAVLAAVGRGNPFGARAEAAEVALETLVDAKKLKEEMEEADECETDARILAYHELKEKGWKQAREIVAVRKARRG